MCDVRGPSFYGWSSVSSRPSPRVAFSCPAATLHFLPHAFAHPLSKCSCFYSVPATSPSIPTLSLYSCLPLPRVKGTAWENFPAGLYGHSCPLPCPGPTCPSQWDLRACGQGEPSPPFSNSGPSSAPPISFPHLLHHSHFYITCCNKEKKKHHPSLPFPFLPTAAPWLCTPSATP